MRSSAQVKEIPDHVLARLRLFEPRFRRFEPEVQTLGLLLRRSGAISILGGSRAKLIVYF
jgi:hypothetical protein